MNIELISAQCPACSYFVASPFFDGGNQPLATLAWPASVAEAQAMPRYPLNFVQCPSCSHVYNRSFEYTAIPYEDKPNRMFNCGAIWGGHLANIRDMVLSYLPDSPTVIEIGCGEGHFLRGLAGTGKPGRFVGFDPNGNKETGRGIEFRPRLFNPVPDMAEIAPDMVIIRHVIEHLLQPAAMLEPLAWASLHKPCWLFAEVPCIDRVFATERLADFFYEHYSHFTTASFEALMRRAGHIEKLAHGYDGEVVYAIVQLGVNEAWRQQADVAHQFFLHATVHQAVIAHQLDDLAVSGKRVAIWGGTGKAAAFIHQFRADAARFPLVIDSDPEKAGTFVPGTGQEIQFRDVLKKEIIDVVIIPTQWRARDIVAEMEREHISAQKVLIEHQGRLIDFHRDIHPY